jgi:hypothetical protein
MGRQNDIKAGGKGATTVVKPKASPAPPPVPNAQGEEFFGHVKNRLKERSRDGRATGRPARYLRSCTIRIRLCTVSASPL